MLEICRRIVRTQPPRCHPSFFLRLGGLAKVLESRPHTRLLFVAVHTPLAALHAEYPAVRRNVLVNASGTALSLPQRSEYGNPMKNLTWHRMILMTCFVFGAQALWAESASADPAPAERAWDSERFVGGCPVSVTRPVAGNLMAAGCDVEVLAEVAGNLAVLGGNLRMTAPVDQDLYAAGGRVSLDAVVQNNVRIAGGKVDLGPNAKVAGDVAVAGGDIEIDGAIRGDLQVAAGRVRINGPVGGDVKIAAGEVELGPDARIEGRLSYASGREIRRDSAAQVLGGVEWGKRGPASHHWQERARTGVRWVWSLGLLAIAIILASAFPLFYKGVAETARTRWAMSLLIGFIVLVCVPAAALIAMITVIGIPLALVMIALYIALLIVGYISTGIALGEIALQHWRAERAASTGWRIAAVVLAMLVLGLLRRVPIVGGFVVFAATLIGIGVLLMQFRSGTAALGTPKT